VLLLATVAAFVLLGHEVCRRVWVDRLGPFERASYSGLIAVLLWIGTLWITAIAHIMTAPVLVGRTVIVAAAALGMWWLRRKGILRTAPPSVPGVTAATILLVAVPLVIWSVFILWRGVIIPPVSHDALSHHLPKAVLFSRAAGYEHLSFLDARIRNIPANYELMLAETLLIEGDDDITEWLSLLFYLLLFVGSAALCERWWQTAPAASSVMGLLVAGVPVALLHSGAHKNDLLTAALIVGALLLAGRWMMTREPSAAIMMVTVFAAAVGTKPQAAAVALCAAPLLLRGLTAKILLKLVAAALIAFLLLGGYVFISNVVNEGAVIGVSGSHDRETVVAYGDWANVWQAPYVLLAAPFVGTTYQLPVPWSEVPWFWRKYEIFFSHLGIPFALCAIATPFVMVMVRGNLERLAVTAVAVLALVLMLPVDFRPHGMFTISLPRYALYVAPVVFGWTAGPLLRGRLVLPLAVIAAISFSAYGMDNAEKDTFAPMEYVRWAKKNPGTRVVAFDPNRAASLVDRRAGPHDGVAIDAGYGTWIHPAFGKELKRPVHFIPQDGGPLQIPAGVRWVAIDRSYASIWEHPDFRDLSQARQFLVRGKPGPEEMRVFNALQKDPRFELVVYNRITNQAVFRRIQ
jgi:hypothetical protein